nr:Ig-like domain-containing protein [Lachnospiraceae bacterium]
MQRRITLNPTIILYLLVALLAMSMTFALLPNNVYGQNYGNVKMNDDDDDEDDDDEDDDDEDDDDDDEDEIAVTGVSLDKTSITLKKGKTYTLEATVEPEDADDDGVSWDSSDESVATVSEDGEVKAVSYGTAKITVTTDDGEYTASCTVNVPGMELNTSSVVLNVGKSSSGIKATLVKDKIKSVKSANENVATVSFKGSTITIKGVAKGST